MFLVSLSNSPSLIIIVEMMLTGSAERPALSSINAKFSTLDEPEKMCLEALISGLLPSEPS